MNAQRRLSAFTFTRLTTPSAHLTEPGDRRNAQLLSGLILIIVVFGLLNGVIQFVFVPDFGSTFVFVIVGVSLMGVAYGISRTQHYRISALVAAIVPSFVAYLNYVQNPDDVISVGFMIVGVLLGSIFLDMRLTLFLSLGNIIAVLSMPLVTSASVAPSGAPGFVVMMCGLILLAKYHRNQIEIVRRNVLLQTQTELQESFDRLRNVMEHMPFMVCALDMDENAVVWNDEATRITGYPASEILGTDRVKTLIGWDRAHDDEADSFDARQIEFKNRTGETKTILFSNMSKRFPIPGWSTWGVALDITEQKAAEHLMLEHERLKLSFQTEQDQTAITQLLIQRLTHDLRTSLQIISMARDHLSRSGGAITDDEREKRLDSIGNQIRLANKLIIETVDAVLGNLDQRGFKPASINLSALCQVSVNHIRGTNKSDHTLRFVDKGEVKMAVVDEMLVNRILINLLSNAIKYSPDGGEIVLELGKRDHWIELRISDQGIGISEEELPYIFEQFYRSETVATTYEGTGIGLNTVRECVTRHKGQIHVESTPGKGTTFTVLLPGDITLDVEGALAG